MNRPGFEAQPGSGLNDDEVRMLWLWVVAANGWSEASQGLVQDASELTRVSRDLADLFAKHRPAGDEPPRPRGLDRGALASDLRLLAEGVEEQTGELRDGYLATAENLKAYHSLLD